jgi:acyl-CoA synthetase (NDP forming)
LLDSLFAPQAVAVVGASADQTKLGYIVLDNIAKYGYIGEVHPVNPKADEILGRKSYPRLTEIPGPVDLAVAVVPNRFVVGVMNDCGEKGVGAAIIITAGFREAGAEGRQMEREVIEVAQKYNIRVVGPNCLGVIDTNSSLNASFAAGMPGQGKISFRILGDGAGCERGPEPVAGREGVEVLEC